MSNILKRGLIIGIIIFIITETVARLGIPFLNALGKIGALDQMGSLVGGLVIGAISFISVLSRPLSSIVCIIFNVDPFVQLLLPPSLKNLEFILMGINLLFWISVSTLFLYKNDMTTKGQKYGKQLFIIIILWILIFFAITTIGYYFFNSTIEQRLSKVDIAKQILGSWDDGSKSTVSGSSQKKYVETFYPNNTFKIEIVASDANGTTKILHEGSYRMEGNIIKCAVERTTSPYGGWKFERKIIDIDSNRFLYIDKYGGIIDAKRIK